jgi:hypothetical protein
VFDRKITHLAASCDDQGLENLYATCDDGSVWALAVFRDEAWLRLPRVPAGFDRSDF